MTPKKERAGVRSSSSSHTPLPTSSAAQCLRVLLSRACHFSVDLQEDGSGGRHGQFNQND